MANTRIIIRDLRTGYAVTLDDARDGVLIGTADGTDIYHVRTLTKAAARDVLVACLPVIISLLDVPATAVKYAGVTSNRSTASKPKNSKKQLKMS